MVRSSLGSVRSMIFVVVLALGSMAAPALGAFHVMQIEQAIGGVNGNTSAQAIQLRQSSSGQNLVSNARLWAWDSAGNNRVQVLDITSDVSNSATGARVLLATSAFTSLMIAGGQSTFTPDFTLSTPIPASYLSGGRLTYEDDGGSVATPGTIYWSLAFGSYTGPTTGNTQNDADGNFGSFAGSLPSSSTKALLFQGSATAPSTTNSADYALTAGSAVFTKNNGTAFTVVPEPSGAAVWAIAMGLFGASQRRARKARRT